MRTGERISIFGDDPEHRQIFRKISVEQIFHSIIAM
jgi:hypothetical protein